ncbi:MAG: hypothetical protein ACPGVG_00410 [Mycobacterium sp.]
MTWLRAAVLGRWLTLLSSLGRFERIALMGHGEVYGFAFSLPGGLVRVRTVSGCEPDGSLRHGPVQIFYPAAVYSRTPCDQREYQELHRPTDVRALLSALNTYFGGPPKCGNEFAERHLLELFPDATLRSWKRDHEDARTFWLIYSKDALSETLALDDKDIPS